MGFLFGVPDRIRTYDLQYRKLTLYPAELRVHNQFIYTLTYFVKTLTEMIERFLSFCQTSLASQLSYGYLTYYKASIL